MLFPSRRTSKPRCNQCRKRAVKLLRRLRHIDDTYRDHAPVAKQRRSRCVIADMRLQPPDHMPPISRTDQTATAINQARIEQLDQRGEMRIVSVMRRGGQQQQPIAPPRNHLRQASALGIRAIDRRRGTNAVMCLVDDRQIPRRALELLEHALLLGEVERNQAQPDRIERVAAELQFASLFLQCRGIGDDGEPQPKPLSQLLRPLHQQWPRGSDDQHTMRASSRDHLADDKAGLDCLTEPDAVCQQQTRPRQFQRAHQRNELVRLDVDAAGFGQQVISRAPSTCSNRQA